MLKNQEFKATVGAGEMDKAISMSLESLRTQLAGCDGFLLTCTINKADCSGVAGMVVGKLKRKQIADHMPASIKFCVKAVQEGHDECDCPECQAKSKAETESTTH